MASPSFHPLSLCGHHSEPSILNHPRRVFSKTQTPISSSGGKLESSSECCYCLRFNGK